MPGGGLFSLVSYGTQNILLSGNPNFTFFYKNYKKYAHFAEESITQPMDGPQELFYDQPIKVRLKIPRLGDLIRDMYFTFDLPDIYTKQFIPDPATRDAQYNFKWIRYIGCNIIQSIGFYIGGQKIQEFDGGYIQAKAQADYTFTELEKWKTAVGDVPDLTDPANGVFATGTAHNMYPIVYPSPSETALNANRPSIFGRTITVPLPFWFTQSTFAALPLVALQYTECEVQIYLRSIQELYQINDASGNTVRPGFRLKKTIGEPMNPQYIATSSITDVTIDNFLVDWGFPKPLIQSWQLNPRIQATFVYLTDDERKQFGSQTLQYLVRQITTYNLRDVIGRTIEELDTHNPLNRLLIVPRRSDSVTFRNDYANYTNWINATTPPFIPAPAVVAPDSTGLFIPVAGQQQILRTLRMLGDGNELQEDKPIQYFTDIVHWKFMKGGFSERNLIVYPFGLNSPDDQPDGSINSSRIRMLQVDINPYPLIGPSSANPIGSFYAYNFTIYVESLNWVTVKSGTGGLVYAL